MTTAIKPGAFLRRGTAGLSPTEVVALLEHKDELRSLYDELDARRDAALAAIKESETMLAAAEALEADLSQREATLAADLADLEERERAVERFRQAMQVILDAVESVEASFDAANAWLEQGDGHILNPKEIH